MLILPIKKKWFNMILSGEKTEEYREIKPYYIVRFDKIFPYISSEAKICFRNGYNNNSPTFIANCSLSIGVGKKEWGAITNKKYYILKIINIEK